MTELGCRDIVELVTAFVDAELDGEETRLVIAHLPTCAGCRRYVAQVELVVSTLAGFATESLPADIKSKLLVTYGAGRQAS